MIYPIRSARVYRIISKKHPEFSYIGSTFGTLKQRFYQHKMSFKRWKNGKGSNTSSIYEYFDEWGVDDFMIVEMGVYMVCAINRKDRTHLNVWEQLWINRTKGCCNKQDCFTIEYLQKFKNKKYRETHKEQIKKYSETHKEQIQEYRKKYRETHKEQVQESMKKYKEKNREKEKYKITCECGSIVRKTDISTHRKTAKHKRLMINVKPISDF